MNVSLVVEAKELAKALKSLSRIGKPKRGNEAILSFDNEKLEIDLGEMAAMVIARGSWPGKARIPAKAVPALTRLSLSLGDVTIKVDDGTLRIANISFPCIWIPSTMGMIDLPINPTLPMILAMASRHSNEEIETCGLTKLVQSAQEQRTEIIGKAARILAPLRVDREDIDRLADESIRKTNPNE